MVEEEEEKKNNPGKKDYHFFLLVFSLIPPSRMIIIFSSSSSFFGLPFCLGSPGFCLERKEKKIFKDRCTSRVYTYITEVYPWLTYVSVVGKSLRGKLPPLKRRSKVRKKVFGSHLSLWTHMSLYKDDELVCLSVCSFILSWINERKMMFPSRYVRMWVLDQHLLEYVYTCTCIIIFSSSILSFFLSFRGRKRSEMPCCLVMYKTFFNVTHFPTDSLFPSKSKINFLGNIFHSPREWISLHFSLFILLLN